MAALSPMQAPLHAASALCMILSDALMYGTSLLLGGRSVLLVALLGSVLCGALVATIERVRTPDAPATVFQKALAAAAAVAIPLPIVGVALGIVGLVWALLQNTSGSGRIHR